MWVTPESRAELHSATLTFKHLPGRTPWYLNHLFVCNGPSSRYPNDIRILFRPRTAYDKRAFSYSAIQFWNSFSGDIKNLKITKIKLYRLIFIFFLLP